MLDSVISSLQSFNPVDAELAEAKTRYLERVESLGEKMLWKPLDDEHVTASCFVFSTDVDKVLLTFHKKGQFWVQFGGHLEQGDADLPAAALREVREESGIPHLELTGGIVDLNRHGLHGGFSCAAHWDIGFIVLVNPDTEFVVSDESETVGWWPVNHLPENVTDDLPQRIKYALNSLS
ncbi:NUDIX hydrolase [Flaviflexus massiliensis]|uniref:NUDIX hydrolase n=1 Tax=Flaviflexus massiliensis TaxID=1522309 RepID=UPI00097E053B|nr:NUDIX domain-containing protein [Flaviflexus massiliensis]